MSKQLTLSSVFATFAMVAMVLFHTPEQSGQTGGKALVPTQAELIQFSLPLPSFFR